MPNIAQNLNNIREKIEHHCKICGRDPKEIRIMAVTKWRSIEEVEAAVHAGINTIGENRIQEAADKLPLLAVACEKHFIGHLQSNKVKKTLDLFDVIHAVDSLKLAQKINGEAQNRDITIPVFLEINTSGETQKYGFTVEEMKEAFPQINKLSQVTIQGLMTIAKHTSDETMIRTCFKRLRETREQLQKTHNLQQTLLLSMGMSEDFGTAIEEGADIIRIGRLLFK